MLAYDSTRYAFPASTFIAITRGIVGVYIVVRRFSFLAHTLSETGFAGAAFTVWVGQAPLRGMILFTLLGSINVGELLIKGDQRESTISAISALFIGLGVLLLAVAGGNSRYTTNILFGSIIGVDREGVIQLAILSPFALAIIFLVLRQLNYDSFDHVGAVNRHINTSLVSVVFLIVLALTVSIDAQVVGLLLVFILLTSSSSSARYLGKTIPAISYWPVGIALVDVWIGLVSGRVTNLPVTSFISVIEVRVYLLVHNVHATKK